MAEQLRRSIHQTLAAPAKELSSSQKEAELVDSVRRALEQVGRFCRTGDKVPFYFRASERRLYEVDPHPGSEFATLISYLADVTVKRALVGFALDRIRARVAETAETVDVHGLAYNSTDVDLVAVNDFAGGMWRRERGGHWRLEGNGSDSILFWTPGLTVEPWTPLFEGGSPGEDLLWLIRQPNFAADTLTVLDQQTVRGAQVRADAGASILGQGAGGASTRAYA